MEQPRVERTLRLMRLMSGNAYLTVEQLARRLDTSTKSIKGYSGSSKNAANVQALGNAIKDHKTIILKDYASASSGTVRDRVVESFEFTNNHIDIWAYDCEKKSVRLFKIARISWVDILPVDWQHEDEYDKGFLDAFRMQGKTQRHVRLEMTLRARNLLCEEFPLAAPDVTEKDGKFIFDSMVTHLEGVGRFVIGLAADVKIIDSPELEEYVRSYRDQYLLNL